LVIPLNPHWPATPPPAFPSSGPSSHSQHIRPSELSLFPSLLPVLYFQLPNSLFHPSARRSLPPLAHAYRGFYHQFHTAASHTFLITSRPHRVAHPHIAGPQSFPLRSVSLTVTHLPLLSSAQPCHLAYPHFQVSPTSSRAGLPSIIVPSERSISETLQRSYRRSYLSQAAVPCAPLTIALDAWADSNFGS